MAHSTLQSSPEEELFTKFWGQLVTVFGGHTKQSQSSATSIDSNVHLINEIEGKLSKNSRQCWNRINQQEAQIKSLQNQNQQLQGLLDPKLLVDAISQAVTTGLKLGSQSTDKGGMNSKGAEFVSKPYLWKPRPSQLAPDTDESLNLELEWQYCKDTGHLKDNCIKLNHWLAMEQKSDHKVAPTCSSTSNTKLTN